MNVLHILPEHSDNKNESKTPTCAQEHEERKCPKLIWNDLIFLFFIEAVVGVVYNHCQCCVPKTHSFIPLSALYSTRAERWRSEREETLLCFRGSFCKNWESLWWVCLFGFFSLEASDEVEMFPSTRRDRLGFTVGWLFLLGELSPHCTNLSVAIYVTSLACPGMPCS